MTNWIVPNLAPESLALLLIRDNLFRIKLTINFISVINMVYTFFWPVVNIRFWRYCLILSSYRQIFDAFSSTLCFNSSITVPIPLTSIMYFFSKIKWFVFVIHISFRIPAVLHPFSILNVFSNPPLPPWHRVSFRDALIQSQLFCNAHAYCLQKVIYVCGLSYLKIFDSFVHFVLLCSVCSYLLF